MVETKWLYSLNCKIRGNMLNLKVEAAGLFCPLKIHLKMSTLFLLVISQVQIYELEEHKIETWRGENI